MSAETAVLHVLADCAPLMGWLRALRGLALADAYLAAGAVRSSYWAARQGGTMAEGAIRDLDIVYFDPDREPAHDQHLERALASTDATLRWEVTNQAHVHRWYERYTGVAIQPVHSTAEGIALWPETATAIGVQLRDDGQLALLAPCGLEDLTELRWRANPRCPDRSAFARRLAQKQIARDWPGVTVIS